MPENERILAWGEMLSQEVPIEESHLFDQGQASSVLNQWKCHAVIKAQTVYRRVKEQGEAISQDFFLQIVRMCDQLFGETADSLDTAEFFSCLSHIFYLGYIDREMYQQGLEQLISKELDCALLRQFLMLQLVSLPLGDSPRRTPFLLLLSDQRYAGNMLSTALSCVDLRQGVDNLLILRRQGDHLGLYVPDWIALIANHPFPFHVKAFLMHYSRFRHVAWFRLLEIEKEARLSFTLFDVLALFSEKGVWLSDPQLNALHAFSYEDQKSVLEVLKKINAFDVDFLIQRQMHEAVACELSNETANCWSEVVVSLEGLKAQIFGKKPVQRLAVFYFIIYFHCSLEEDPLDNIEEVICLIQQLTFLERASVPITQAVIQRLIDFAADEYPIFEYECVFLDGVDILRASDDLTGDNVACLLGLYYDEGEALQRQHQCFSDDLGFLCQHAIPITPMIMSELAFSVLEGRNFLPYRNDFLRITSALKRAHLLTERNIARVLRIYYNQKKGMPTLDEVLEQYFTGVESKTIDGMQACFEAWLLVYEHENKRKACTSRWGAPLMHSTANPGNHLFYYPLYMRLIGYALQRSLVEAHGVFPKNGVRIGADVSISPEWMLHAIDQHMPEAIDRCSRAQQVTWGPHHQGAMKAYILVEGSSVSGHVMPFVASMANRTTTRITTVTSTITSHALPPLLLKSHTPDDEDKDLECKLDN